MTEPVPDLTTVKPDAADRKPRVIKPPVTDPEAPYGWIKDPNAPGGKRPKLRPGKQAKTETAPRNRPANKARSTPAIASTEKHAKAVTGLTEGMWLLLAAIPPIDFKLGPVDMKTVSVRSRAQAKILEDNQAGLVQALTVMADHSSPVSRALLKLDSQDSPIWIMPVMMSLLPFVVQSMGMYSAPVEEAVPLAARTEERLSAIMGTVMQAHQQESSPNGDSSRAEVHGPEVHADQAVPPW